MEEKIYLPFKIKEKDLESFKSKETIFSLKILTGMSCTYPFGILLIGIILLYHYVFSPFGNGYIPYKEFTLLIIMTAIKNIVIIYHCFGKLRHFRAPGFKLFCFISMIIPFILDGYLGFYCFALERNIDYKFGIDNIKESTIKKYENLYYDKKNNFENFYSIKKGDTRLFLMIFFDDFVINTGFILTILDYFNIIVDNNFAALPILNYLVLILIPIYKIFFLVKFFIKGRNVNNVLKKRNILIILYTFIPFLMSIKLLRLNKEISRIQFILEHKIYGNLEGRAGGRGAPIAFIVVGMMDSWSNKN